MGIGKTRNEEQRNRTWETGDEKWALSFITACPLCIQEHLEQTSATGVSGELEEVETIAYASA